MIRLHWLVGIAFFVACPTWLTGAAIPDSDPAAQGLDPARLKRIDGMIEQAIATKQVPGAVVLLGRRGKIVFAKAAGLRAVVPAAEPMTRDTIFDMASLTKPVATATSVLVLIEEGKLRLSDRLGRVLPEFDNHGKGAITIDQLLRHRAGFVPDNPIGDYKDGAVEAWKRIANIDLVSRPGERFSYSDVGFEVLGKIVEKTGGLDLAAFAEARVFGPLGMNDTRFRPLPQATTTAASPAARIAPTEPDSPKGSMLRGIVHDPRARALGGIAGHAGLFSTADDLAIFAQMMLNGGVGPNGVRVLSPLAVRLMTDAATTPTGQRRGLGWDVDTSYSSPRGALFGRTGFGHTGFTGTSLWIDPETESFVIILTSRLHPDGRGSSPTSLRAEIATLFAAAMVDASPRPALPAIMPVATGESPESRATGVANVSRVECGIDVLAADQFKDLSGLKVGLVTNHTGRTRDGKSTIDALFHAPGVKLTKLFSPEHGIRGALDAVVPNGKDEATNLPIISLYGKTRKPAASDLEGLDALVYDIQDIGARFYTYISTLGLVLESARENNKKVFVLDRPNCIGGRRGVGSGSGRRIRVVHRLSRSSGATWDDRWRAGLALQLGAKDWCGAPGRQVPRLETRRTFRPDGSTLDQSLAEHAELDRSLALSRSRAAGSDEPGDWPRHRHAVRTGRGALD